MTKEGVCNSSEKGHKSKPVGWILLEYALLHRLIILCKENSESS
jgi:hypothetical protein